MRTLLTTVLLLCLLTASAGTALADTLSVSADVPIVYTFSESGLKDPSASGVLVGVSLPFLVGFGAESYKVKGKLAPFVPTDPQKDFQYDVTMLDLFLNLPFPVANLVLGVGAGQGSFDEVPASNLVDTATLTQAYFSIGIPFAVLFDAHVGYHVIRGDADFKDGSGQKLNLDAEMATIGIKVGF